MKGRWKLLIIVSLTILLVSSVLRQKPVTPTSNSYSITESWLNQQIAAWKPAQNSSLILGAHLSRASYAAYQDPGVQQANLNMLVSSGASCIRIDIGYAPWLTNDQASISRMNSMVASIKSAARCLVLADASSESYRSGGQIPWERFKTAWVQRVTVSAQLYQPDYYIVVKEPGWYYPMIKNAGIDPHVYDANEWGNLTASLTNGVKSVSPNTKVGVAVSAYELYNDPSTLKGQDSVNSKFLKQAEQVSSLDFIGFDIYDAPGFDGTQQFLREVGSGGKAVWIPEAWSSDPPMSPPNPQLDKQWILALYYFAQHIHAQAILPFYTDFFSDYALPNQSDANTIIALYNSRTAVFYEFQKIISSK